jgi:hypothetical protein
MQCKHVKNDLQVLCTAIILNVVIMYSCFVIKIILSLTVTFVSLKMSPQYCNVPAPQNAVNQQQDCNGG